MKPNLWSRIADRTVFVPGREPLDPGDRIRWPLQFSGASGTGEFECWGWDRSRPPSLPESQDGSRPWVILKFPGTAGRAELASEFPASLLAPHPVSAIWTVNPPGYGTSPGRPSLATMPDVITAAWQAVRQRYPDSRLLVTGTSLGCVWALAGSAVHQADGLLLRNPPPLRELIRQRWRYNWWNLGAARWVAHAIPESLDAVRNAGLCPAPKLFIQSLADRLVPPRWQNLIIHACQSPVAVLAIPDLDHAGPLPDATHTELRQEFTRLFLA